MKILFVCNVFGPANKMAAIRPTKLAKYFSMEDGIIVDVVSQCDSLLLKNDEILQRDIKQSDISVQYVENGKTTIVLQNLIKRLTKTSNHTSIDVGKKQSNRGKDDSHFLSIVVKGFKKHVLYLFNRIITKDKARQMIKAIKKSGYYDVVISFGPNCADYVGRWIKKNNRNTKWIADFRDPFYSEMTPVLFRPYAKAYADRVVNAADKVIAVSPGYLNSLFLKRVDKGLVLSNGFDPDDTDFITSDNLISCKVLSFLCVGELYKGKRRIDPLFKCLSELSNEGKIYLPDVQIHYAGNNDYEIMRDANEYNLNSIVTLHGFVSRTRSLSLQNQASVLLLPSWNEFKGQDIMPGKLLEFLMMNKPILAIVSGKEPECYVKKIIDETGSGFCYEEASGSSYLSLKNYVLKIYNRWKNSTDLFQPNHESVCKYNYKNIANKYIRIIKELEEQKND